MEKIGDQPVSKITSADVLDYMTYLRTEYVPHTFAKPNPAHEAPTRKLSPKTLRNHWITFKAFFGWAVAEFKIKNPMEGIPGPRYKEAPVAAFTQEDLAALFKACVYSREYNPINRHNFVTRRPSAKRDEAMILFMLDTGLRASELCSLKIGELDLRTGQSCHQAWRRRRCKRRQRAHGVHRKEHPPGRMAILADREDRDDPESPVFINRGNHPFNSNSLRHLIVRLAEKAGVKGAHPHKFRHTFAITYLRSGGDVFTLQALLGHSSLDMVRHYAQIAEMDIERVHRKASPVDNLRF